MRVPPTTRAHFLAFRLVLALSAGCGLAQSARAGDHPEIVRVRSTDPFLARLIEQAAAHSGTFHRLVATIQRSNGIVQVEPGRCGRAVRACLPIWMETVGADRFLRVTIDRRPNDTDVDVMASIGHELQHAVEALGESAVIDSTTLYFFFRRSVPTDNEWRFETAAAIQAGRDIRQELRRR